jgi:hypothetical protein
MIVSLYRKFYREFLIRDAERLVLIRGIVNPPDFRKMTILELEYFKEIFLWDLIDQVSL